MLGKRKNIVGSSGGTFPEKNIITITIAESRQSKINRCQASDNASILAT